MSDRTLKGIIGLVVAGLVAVIALGAVFGSSATADDLRDRSQTALAAASLDDVSVDFRGREAELRGGNDVEIRLAGKVVAALPGVRRVALDVVADRPVDGAAHFELDRAGDVVQIRGVVPHPDDAAAVKVGVATGLHIMINGDLAVDRSLAPAAWTTELPDVFAALGQVEDLELTILGDGSLVLGGTVESAPERERLVRLVARKLPDLEVVDQLEGFAPRREQR